MSNLKGTTLIEKKSPILRRNTVSSISNILRTSFAEGFMSFIDSKRAEIVRPSLKESEEMIECYFKRIDSIIVNIDQHIANRLEHHETQIFSIVKKQIEEMKMETQEMVKKLNEAIDKKNTEDEIWLLNNQLDYFKNQTFKLFEENKKFRIDIQQLKIRIEENKIDLDNNDKVMQKLRKSYLKQKNKRDKIASVIKQSKVNFQNPQGQKEKGMLNKIEIGNKDSDEGDIAQLGDTAVRSRDFQLNKMSKNSQVIITMLEDFEFVDNIIKKGTEEQLLSSEEQLSKLKLIKIESIICQSIPKIQQSNKVNKLVQTDQHVQQDVSNKCISISKKQLKLRNLGFHVKNYNKKERLKTDNQSYNRENKGEFDKDQKYMTNSFNRSKIRVNQSLNQFEDHKNYKW